MLSRLLTAATLARTADAGGGVVLVLASVQAYDGPGPGALILSALLIPHVVAGPFVGLVMDRARSPRLVHAAFVAVFGVSLGAVLLSLGRVPLPVVAGLALLAGVCGSMIFGGLSSRVDDVVPPPGRPRARGLDASTYNVAEITGPAAAAVLVAAAGVPVAGAVMTGACLLAAVALLGVRSPVVPRPDGPRAGVRAAAAAIVTSKPLRAVTAASGFAAVGMGMLTPIAVVLGGTRGGFLVTALGVGALAGSLLAARFPVRRWSQPRMVFTCLAGAGAVFAGLLAGPSWPVLLGIFAVAGLCEGPVLASVLAVRSAESPPGARTQVFTIGAGVKLTAAAAGAAAFTLVAAAPAVVLLSVPAVTHLLGAAVGLLLGGRSRPATPTGGTPRVEDAARRVALTD